MVHGVRLRDGKAEWYRNRWIRSTRVSEALGEEPAPGERHGGFDGANTNVVGIGGRTFAIVEAGARPVELTYELDTIEHSDLGGTLPNGYTAHPKVDPVTGDRHAVAYHWALPHLQYVVIGPDARVRQIEPIETPDGPMVHDCSITERWTVIYDLPVTFDLELAMGGNTFPYVWNDAHQARLGLLPLGGRGDQVRWFDVAPCYVFHPLNAHDDGDNVVLDVVRYDRMFDAHRLGPDDAAPLLWRWTIDTVTGRGHRGAAVGPGLRVPRVDERRRGPPPPLGLRHRGRPAVGRGRERVRRSAGPRRRQDRQQRGHRPRGGPPRRRVGHGPAPRPGRRGRRLARHASCTTPTPTAASSWSCPPRSPAPVRWPGSCSPPGCRSGSTATGSPTDRAGSR